jgi:hypothetical protein
MAARNGEVDDVTVKDDEEYVAKRIKKQILDSRQLVNEREDVFFAGELLDPDINLSQEQKVESWGNTVRQYIRDIEPLLRNFPAGVDDQGRDICEFYRESIQLGEVRLVPPDTRSYDFSAITAVDGEEFTERDLKRELNLPPQVDLPHPHRVEFGGLLSIVDYDARVSYQWRVNTNPGGFNTAEDYVTLQQSRIVPKYVYESAVRAANMFLDEIGIGIEVDGGEYHSVEPGL